MRYLEGIAAETRLLGVVPRSGEFDELLPRDAILEVAPDGSDLAERLDFEPATLERGSDVRCSRARRCAS